jgi:Protein of unknown function (DUF998)
MSQIVVRSAPVKPVAVPSWRSRLGKAVLAFGVLAPIYYIVINDVIAASLYPGYDRIARPVSELSATYAPSRSVLVPLDILYVLLMIAFWIGVWRVARSNRALRLTAGLMLGSTILGLGLFAFPMKTTEMLGANLVHTVIFGVINPLLMLVAIGASAAAFGKRFRLYAILSVLALAGFSALVAAGGSAPWFGLLERAVIGVSLVWVAVLSITLLRARPASGSR